MKISIIMASYNYANYIKQAIDSILNQTYKNWELIIVDDGSLDNSLEIINNYVENNENISFYKHENGLNKGLSATLQLGLSKATGDYIAFLESDDYWTENHLEEKVKILKSNPAIKFIFNQTQLFGDAEVIKDHLEKTNYASNLVDRPDSYEYMPFSFLEMSVVGTFSSMMIEKNVINECNFNTPYGPYLDWWLCHQIAIKHKMYFLNKKLTYWRLHKKSYTNEKYSKQNQQKIDNYFRKLYQNYILNLSQLKVPPKNKFNFLILICLKWIAVPRWINKILRGSINKLKKEIIGF